MKIADLLEGVEILGGDADTQVSVRGVTFDSRKTKPGDLFVALEGGVDGHEYAYQAIDNGAVCIIAEKPVGAPHILVANTRKALAVMAGNLYSNAHKRLKIITVVGTNGKTTTTYIINSILKANGHMTAVIGTLGAVIDNKRIKTDLTTPDPLEMHRLFAEAEKSGAEYVIMEVSAHAIYFSKLEGVTAEVAVFTNVSQDHLDFFGTMENYTKVKTSYFEKSKIKLGIINSDDIYGRSILHSGKALFLSYGIDNPADVFAVDAVSFGEKTRFLVNACDDVADITVPLLGKFNIYNTLAAIAVAKALSVPLSIVRKALASMKEIRGRFNIIKSDITVIIDYAHTPDGLENLLKAAKTVEGGKLITVFGCGGNRDAAKRPIMGRIAGAYSDFCIITSDNPRLEEPMSIITQIEKGMRESTQNYICIKDRTNAIAYAVSFAKKGDKVVIAGKGAENYIDIMGKKIPYSDKKAVTAALESYRA
ncbi:MAG: UDP-N-acetylmuramoyl-L-alanyl-D-glutamate--2,6-diaminopimelate ligase [Clostridia bacterium]|nr:UDP-N-acetylmuramoyl-L-alanyl-D-glutamate--2,6-diaminopimelate ligase [Clostridia bacterium]